MSSKCLLFAILTASLFFSSSGEFQPLDVLEKFGYLPKSAGANRGEDRSPEMISKAIRDYQKFAGLDETGIVDEETKQKMVEPRCGVKDVYDAGQPAPGGPASLRELDAKWPKRDITWSIKSYSKTSPMSQERQLYAIQQGFRRWAEVAPLNFRQVTGKADIELSFGKLDHGDDDYFDGLGGTLAHAYPPVDGRAHFDDDEQWTEATETGKNLEHVATHEIGHALGLYHLPGLDFVMSPYYPGYIPNFRLRKYDILEIQRRYGKRVTPILRNSPLEKFCGQNYKTLQAAIRGPKGVDFIFVDRKYVISGVTGRKTFISRMFRGGPTTVDAAVYSKEYDTIYLFKGRRVWGFTSGPKERFVLKPGFPKNLENNELRNPEVAFRVKEISGQETIVLIKEGKTWIWMPYFEMLAPGAGFPVKEIFPNVPSRIDAAISDGKNVYFISGKTLYSHRPIFRITTKRSTSLDKFFKCIIN